MSFLLVNSRPVSARLGSWRDRASGVLGRRRMSAYGRAVPGCGVQGYASEISAEITPQDATEGAFLRCVLSGDGCYRYGLAGGLFSAFGPRPLSTSSYTAVAATTYFGDLFACIKVDFAVWPMELLGDWTVGFVRDSTGVGGAAGAGWKRTFVRSDGAKWENGVRNDALSTTYLAVSSSDGSLTFDDTGSAVTCELVVWRCQLPADYITGEMETRWGTNRVKYPEAPLVEISSDDGALAHGEELVAMPSIGAESYFPMGVGGSGVVNNARSFTARFATGAVL